MRALLERLSRGVVLKRRLPARFGGRALFVTPDSRLGFWRRDLEGIDRSLFRAAEAWVRPGDTVWDVGANVGLFAFAAAAVAGPAGRVLAVEADTWLAGLLRRSAALPAPRSASVMVLCAGVDGKVGLGSFHIAARGRASNALEGYGSTQQGGERETQLVIAVTLDWLLAHQKPPQVVKIDVEGAEMRVLAGATQLLDEVRPLVLCEVSGENRGAATEFFRSRRYVLYDLETGADSRRALDRAVENTVAVPGEAAGDGRG